MPRPRQCRYVATTPSVTYFKPRGIPMTALEEVCLGVEELEALRLADLEGLTGSEAACRMRVSRHTFGRTLAAARRTGALALVTGRALRIEGGHYALAEPDHRTTDAKENTMQKIAISSEGPTLDDLVDPRFGRAGGFEHPASRERGVPRVVERLGRERARGQRPGQKDADQLLHITRHAFTSVAAAFVPSSSAWNGKAL